MNSTGMIAHREYVDVLHIAETSINDQLIKYAEKFFKKTLSTKETNDLKAMDIQDKFWLLDQYKLEVKFNKQPDLSNLY
jgi:hypothetical protein